MKGRNRLRIIGMFIFMIGIYLTSKNLVFIVLVILGAIMMGISRGSKLFRNNKSTH
jgi:hypothetical protein